MVWIKKVLNYDGVYIILYLHRYGTSDWTIGGVSYSGCRYAGGCASNHHHNEEEKCDEK